jgi:imidazolonepropionase-like amidohydrolase
MMQSIPFAGGTSHDPRQDSRRDAVAVLLEDSLINEVSDRPRRAQSIRCIGSRGSTVTPGLIDARRHLVLTRVCCFVEHAL